MLRAAAFCTLWANPALADLVVCNALDEPASVAVGYQDGADWVSEGWWNTRPGSCLTVIPGELQHRFYYWRANTAEGPLPSQGFEFCIRSQMFTIRGDADCEARGYLRATFSEMDTGGDGDHVLTLTPGG